MITHRIAGRKYILAMLEARPRRVRSKGHEYIQYVINVPKKLATLLEEMNKPNMEAWRALDPEDQGPHPIPLTVLVTPSPWHHLIDWDEMSARAYLQLPHGIRRELEALGLGPVPEKERVLVPVPPSKLRELGLDPEKQITYEDLEEAIRKKLLEELQPPGSDTPVKSPVDTAQGAEASPPPGRQHLAAAHGSPPH